MKDYYKILKVTKSSTEDEIRKNYRKLAMQYHPDRNPDSPEAEEKFKEVAEAYGVLTDPVKRRRYNRSRASGKGDFSSANGTDRLKGVDTTGREQAGKGIFPVQTAPIVFLTVKRIFFVIFSETPVFSECFEASCMNFKDPVFAQVQIL